jgi:predicted AAA+ superfamily ATPase
VISGQRPQLVDKWHLEATIVWNYVRDQVNRRGFPGQFVLTGSAVPDVNAARRTGAGRIDRLRMRPMSLFESGESTGGMSLGALLAGASASSLLSDLNTFGYLFESMAIRDCRIYSYPLDGAVYHYRDSDDLEVDIVCETPGAWGAFEVKVGFDGIDQGAASLLKFAEKVDTSRVGDPAVLGVITATGYGYTRPDGVVVIPIGAFGP